MIDKNLIHQAAEDIDIFDADLTEEYEELKDLPRTPRKKAKVVWIGIAASIAACFIGAFVFYGLDETDTKPIASVYRKVPEHEPSDVVNDIKIGQKQNAKVLAENNVKAERRISKETAHSAYHSEENLVVENQSVPANTSQPKAIPVSQKQEEWGMDVYISQLCSKYGVQGQQLSCNNEEKPSGTLYVFPDDPNVNLFSRFQQIASRYEEHEGFRLSYSRQQFCFQLNGNTGRELWLAERSNNRIYLYRTHSASETAFSTSCFYNYKQKTFRKSNNYC